MDINTESSLSRHELTNEHKLQNLNSLQVNCSLRNSRLSNGHSSRQDATPSPAVDTDITILNETREEKADRLLQEANKRDIALMATSSQATTRYAALYAASKNRGLDISLGRTLTNLEAAKNKNIRMIHQIQESMIDDFRRTRLVSLRQGRPLKKHKSDSCIQYGKKNSFKSNFRNIKLPPIRNSNNCDRFKDK